MVSQIRTVALQEATAIFTAVLTIMSLLILYAPFSSSLDGIFRRFPAQKVVKALEDDPFTVAKEDDFKDGLPLQSTQAIQTFWTKIAQRKTVIILLQIVIIATWSRSFALKCAFVNCDSESTPDTKGVYIFLASSILAIASLSVRDRQDRQQHHARSINHLSFLLTVKAAVMCSVTILPAPTVRGTSTEFFDHLFRDWNIDLFCTCLSWLFVVTTPLGPRLHYSQDKIYSSKTLAALGAFPEHNLSEEKTTSLLGRLFFSYSEQVFMLGRLKALVTLNQLPILPARLRASVNLSEIKYAIRHVSNPFSRFMHPESSFQLAYHILRANLSLITKLQIISFTAAVMFYVPIALIQQFLRYLEKDPLRQDTSWGWFYVIGIFVSQYLLVIINAQLWSVSSNDLRPRIGLQLNTLIYSKTLVRKDAPSTNSTIASSGGKDTDSPSTNFSSKAEVMTLMTTDVGRAGDLARLCFSLTDCTIGIAIGTYMLYYLLGNSAFVGLAVAICLVPLNQLAGKSVVSYQQNVMKCRGERVALTNELLGAIRMIKFMAWERSFEQRVLNIRTKELRYQKRIFILETLWNSMGESIPLFFAVACFWHFSVIRREELTPAIAFTAIIIFTEIKFALTELPAFFVQVVQSFVSLGRIAKYIHLPEVKLITISDTLSQSSLVGCSSATVSWPQTRSSGSGASSVARNTFSLINISTVFPPGQLSLVCGKTGAGKTLLLLSLLGEADILSGRVMCPRSAVNSFELLQQFEGVDDWLLDGICAYVPQAPWLRNQTIKENILFNLPFNANRYKAVLEACALNYDLAILEGGDEAEIGEQGINLSGGQKARISLARAVYSRASILLLDDVLSAVDAHTAHHLWQRCFKGDLMRKRTVILVSHHLQLCGPDASHILALEQGRLRYSGPWSSFQGSVAMQSVITSIQSSEEDTPSDSDTAIASPDPTSLSSPPDYSRDTVAGTAQSSESEEVHVANIVQHERRKVVQDEETRQEGRISKDVWLLYIHSAGGFWFWLLLSIAILLSAFSPLWEKGWLKIWSASDDQQRVVFYMGTYSAIVSFEIVAGITRWVVLYDGSIRASKALYETLLETVLFASLRFHDTISRGRLLNRFGKDFEGETIGLICVDNNLPNELGRTVIIGISLIITMSSLVFIAGQSFLLLALIIIATALYIAQAYGHVARDLRRLSSTTSSPLFSVYGETISGLIVIRAFGMPTKFLHDMITCADTNMNPTYWSTGMHRWFSVRFQVAATFLLGLMALIILLHPSIDASWAGLALTFASTLTIELYWFVRRWIDAEQVMVALERIREYSVTIPAEAPEFVEPRPPAAWPTSGRIQCENLSIKYAPELPYVLKNLNFEIKPGEKIGLIGRTGSGKSTLGLSLMRFVEPTMGRILIDGLDIAQIGLTDLRSRVSIIPQDPILLSGTIRSSLDVLGEYDDAEIYDVLRRVNLLSSNESPVESDGEVHHVFANLESPVSELGENFSAGEKQLLCMARALLRRSKILIMDEATASVDYATDEVISQTIREAFADSTILTIAHRLRTVIDYDRVMVMDQGNVVEFDSPSVLINQEHSVFHGLCKAAGEEEFSKLQKMAHSTNE